MQRIQSREQNAENEMPRIQYMKYDVWNKMYRINKVYRIQCMEFHSYNTMYIIQYIEQCSEFNAQNAKDRIHCME